MKLIVGLGNPGRAYERTRHNAGFVAAEAAAAAWGWPWTGTMRSGGRDVARYAQGAIGAGTVRLVEPLTFMNLSGTAVGPYVRRQAIAPSDVLGVCDEVQLPPGRLRLRAGGTAGGHHGLESMIAALGTQEFPRLRIGVGRQPLPADLAGFVLARMAPPEWAQLLAALPRVVAACESWVRQDVVAAMNHCNREVKESSA